MTSAVEVEEAAAWPTKKGAGPQGLSCRGDISEATKERVSTPASPPDGARRAPSRVLPVGSSTLAGSW